MAKGRKIRPNPSIFEVENMMNPDAVQQPPVRRRARGGVPVNLGKRIRKPVIRMGAAPESSLANLLDLGDPPEAAAAAAAPAARRVRNRLPADRPRILNRGLTGWDKIVSASHGSFGKTVSAADVERIRNAGLSKYPIMGAPSENQLKHLPQIHSGMRKGWYGNKSAINAYAHMEHDIDDYRASLARLGGLGARRGQKGTVINALGGIDAKSIASIEKRLNGIGYLRRRAARPPNQEAMAALRARKFAATKARYDGLEGEAKTKFKERVLNAMERSAKRRGQQWAVPEKFRYD